MEQRGWWSRGAGGVEGLVEQRGWWSRGAGGVEGLGISWVRIKCFGPQVVSLVEFLLSYVFIWESPLSEVLLVL